jgi:hypothetical protein
VVVHDGRVFLLDVGKDGARVVGAPLAVAGARAVRLSADGSAAYVLAARADGDRLAVIDLAAGAGARVVTELPLGHRGELLASAAEAARLAVVGDGKLTLLQYDHPSAPAPFGTVALPKEAAAMRAIELTPDGNVLAGLVPDGNRLVALEVDHPPAARLISEVELLPSERLPLVRDLAFSSDGETLWVVSGANADTLPVVQSTRLTALRLVAHTAPSAPIERLVSLWRTQSVPGATAPLRVAVARGQPLASGTTIRMPPEKAAVFVGCIADSLFKLGEHKLDGKAGLAAFEKLWRPSRPGMIARADINGGGGPMFNTPEILSALDLTPDAQLLVATAVHVLPAPATPGIVLDFGVVVAKVWGPPAPLYVSLAPLPANQLHPPFSVGEIRIQP